MTSTNNNDTTSWQSLVPQEQRTNEINNIAKELANLEPSATTQSKLGLASKFENKFFTSATSFADYKKKMDKRLKKLCKNYKARPSTGAVGGVGTAGAGAGAGAGGASGESIEMIEEQIILKKRKLRLEYGDRYRFIAENGKVAIDKYPRLTDHINRSNENAAEIGALPAELAVRVDTGKPLEITHRAPHQLLEHLTSLEVNLEQKLNTLREYILKYAQAER